MACFFSLCVAIFIVTCPGVRAVFYARPFNITVATVPLVGGLCIVLYEAVRRWVGRSVDFHARVLVRTGELLMKRMPTLSSAARRPLD